MSRIGKAPISIPTGVEVMIEKNNVVVKGNKKEMKLELTSGISAEIVEGILTLNRPSESKEHKAKHGLYRSLINNMIIGVSTGFKKDLELIGVGYRATAQGQLLDLSLGFSHNILVQVPDEISIETTAVKGKNPTILLSSHDKQLLGMVASKIRSFRKPEPYKGKGIKFVGELIRRKAGKSA